MLLDILEVSPDVGTKNCDFRFATRLTPFGRNRGCPKGAMMHVTLINN
jgi:hypothetical protein